MQDNKGNHLPNVQKRGNMDLKKADSGDILSGIDVINDTEKALTFLSKLVGSKNIGAQTPEEALSVYLQCKELGIPFITASNNMNVVKGKVGLGIHIIRGLLLSKGKNITWEKTRNNEPLYKYTDGVNFWESFLTGINFIKYLEELSSGYYNTKNTAFAFSAEQVASNKTKGIVHNISTHTGTFAPIDWVTSYKFTRYRKLELTDEVVPIYVESKFSYTDAIKADLLKDDSAWVKFFATQCDNRAFVFGAREIADDIINGIYELSELYDAFGIKYNMQGDSPEVVDTDAEDFSNDQESSGDDDIPTATVNK